MLYFISNNLNKFEEIKTLIPEIQLLNIDLTEIQSLDSKKVIEAKLEQAKLHHDGEFLIEDTSLNIRCLGGLPGPLIKWFLQSLGAEGLYSLTKDLKDDYAEAHTYIGYMNQSGKAKYYHGNIVGHIVQPRGDKGFGWDFIFQPDGWDLTFAEMTKEQKQSISMRRQALDKFLLDVKA